MSKEILILKGDRPNESATGSFFTWENLQRFGSDQYFLEQYSDIIISLINGELRCVSATTGRDIASYDLVYIRDITHENVRNTIAMYLSSNGKKFINSELQNTQYTDKLLQYVAFSLAGLPIPNTVFADKKYRVKAADLLSYPLVVKSTTGSNGRDNFLVHTSEELEKLEVSDNFVLQTFIPNQFDYRVIVADDTVLLGYKRVRQDDSTHKNNVSQGANRELVDGLTNHIRDTAVSAARVLGRNISGVDILENTETGELVILEVNFNYGSPRFEAPILEKYFRDLAQYLNKKASEL